MRSKIVSRRLTTTSSLAGMTVYCDNEARAATTMASTSGFKHRMNHWRESWIVVGWNVRHAIAFWACS